MAADDEQLAGAPGGESESVAAEVEAGELFVESWGYVVTDLGAQRLRTWARQINARRAPARPVRAVA